MEKYHKDLQAWENEQKRQWEEFRIEDEELENRLVSTLIHSIRMKLFK